MFVRIVETIDTAQQNRKGKNMMQKYDYRQAVKEAILTFLGDNVDYYLSPADYETAADFKKAVFLEIMFSDIFTGYTAEEAAENLGGNFDLLAQAIKFAPPEDVAEAIILNDSTYFDTLIRKHLVSPVLDEIFQESITEQDFIAMKAERE